MRARCKSVRRSPVRREPGEATGRDRVRSPQRRLQPSRRETRTEKIDRTMRPGRHRESPKGMRLKAEAPLAMLDSEEPRENCQNAHRMFERRAKSGTQFP